jgi:hypothetical protein
MRNLNPKDVLTTTEIVENPSTMTTVVETTELLTTTQEPTTVEATTLADETTTTEDPMASTTTELATTVLPTTEEPKTTTQAPSTTTKIFSVDFMPKRKPNKNQASAQLKNSPERSKDRPRKQKTTANSTKLAQVKQSKLNKDYQLSKSNRVGSKQRKISTTEPTVAASTTLKPFYWLPPSWSIDQSKEKPVLVRFWKNQPLSNDARHYGNQRMNSRMPTAIFREVPQEASKK